MIFMVVGNGKFDSLVEEVDKLKMESKIKKEVVFQIGHGNYIPKQGKWFRFESNLDKYYQKADLIISHGGPGAVFEILQLGKKLIALPNRERTDPRHQVEYLQAMAQETSALLYCDSIDQLEKTLKKARIHQFEKYHSPQCHIHQVIKNFLK